MVPGRFVVAPGLDEQIEVQLPGHWRYRLSSGDGGLIEYNNHSFFQISTGIQLPHHVNELLSVNRRTSASNIRRPSRASRARRAMARLSSLRVVHLSWRPSHFAIASCLRESAGVVARRAPLFYSEAVATNTSYALGTSRARGIGRKGTLLSASTMPISWCSGLQK